MARAKAGKQTKARAKAREQSRTRPHARKGARAKAGGRKTVSIREIAERSGVTPSAIYARIKRGELKVTRVDGRYVVTRKAMLDMEKLVAKIWADWERSRRKQGPLTDDEFLQALWDSDPD